MNAAEALSRLERAQLRLVTTSEAAALWGTSRPAASAMLLRFARSGLFRPIRRGLWGRTPMDVLEIVDRLAEPDLAYVSLLTALRYRGLIEQIPPQVQAVTTGRARRIRTPIGTVAFHHIAGELFGGFERENGAAMATAEKALFDTLYLSATKIRSFARLPEIELPRSFSRAQARRWARSVRTPRLRTLVETRLDEILRASRHSRAGRGR